MVGMKDSLKMRTLRQKQHLHWARYVVLDAKLPVTAENFQKAKKMLDEGLPVHTAVRLMKEQA